jgi:hypothetical protein
MTNTVPVVAKVVAAGRAGENMLRATVMLTPRDDPPTGPLKNWPSTILRWLKGNDWQFCLTFDALKEGCVVPLPPGTGEKGCVGAIARHAKTTWEKQDLEKPLWIDQLWQQLFESCNIKDPWIHLATLLKKSSSGTAFAPGLMRSTKSDVPTIDTAKPLQMDVNKTKNSETVTVDSILPASQSDLALMLELKRAMELCTTLSLAHADWQAFTNTEVACATCAQRKKTEEGAPQLNVSTMHAEASKQFAAAQSAIQSVYAPLSSAAASASACLPDPTAVTQCTAAELAGDKPEDLEKQLHDPLDSYEAANQRESRCLTEDLVVAAEAEDPNSALGQRFFNIQGSPALSRLFCLTFDVFFPEAAVRAALPDQDHGFLYVGVAEKSLDHKEPYDLYTLARYRRDSSPLRFLPASRAEAASGYSGAPAKATHYQGSLVVGQKLNKGQVTRFDLSGLDIRVATEAALDRRASTHDAEVLEALCGSAILAARPAAIARKTFLTAGITLLDRGRQQQAVAQFAARTVHQDRLDPEKKTSSTRSYVLLDSEDLTIGYRIDVAVPVKDPKQVKDCDALKSAKPTFVWRTLMARELCYGMTGAFGARVNAAIESLLGRDPVTPGSTETWRQTIEDGTLTLPARLIHRPDSNSKPKSDSPQTPDKNPGITFAHVEESLATWHGEPMGAQTGGTRDTKTTQEPALPTGCIIALPSGKWGAQRRPPALRFGWPYCFGLRLVFAGGLSISLSEAATLYEQHFNELTVPVTQNTDTSARSRMRRYLRHDRVDAAFLLLPESVACRSHGVMGYERAAHAIVRSIDPKNTRDGDRETPKVTQRVFVVPGVSRNFACMHGVFDHIDDSHPQQGLQGVRFDAEGGGFPVVISDTFLGINDVPFERRRKISTKASDRERGDLVYMTGMGGTRKLEYYPDPAAELYAIGVRHTGTNIYLEGQCLIPTYGPGRAYPNTRPLSLIVRRTTALPHKSSLRTLRDVLSWSDRNNTLGITGAAYIPGAAEAVLTLSPGDDFEVDVWCIPSPERLACWFAINETLGAMILVREDKTDKDSPFTSPEKLRPKLEELLPDKVCDDALNFLEKAGAFGGDSKNPSDWRDGYSAVGGLATPGPKGLTALARALHATLAKRPLDEISAVRTLRATHALDRPHRPPVLSVPCGADRKPGVPPRPLIIHRPAVQTSTTEYTLSGDLVIHLPTTGAVEIRAVAESPRSDKFDDLRRGLSIKQRRLRESIPEKDVSSVFGFSVNQDGEVTLPKSEVVLLRVDSIPAVLDGSLAEEHDGLLVLPLEKLFAVEGPSLYGTCKKPFRFTDPLARGLRLTAYAYPRHAELMKTADSLAVDGKWLRQGQDLQPDYSGFPSECVEIRCPSGMRAAEPHVLSPLPAFIWRDKVYRSLSGRQVKRKTRFSIIRIPLARPWLSSGSKEQLGIVVWPPNFLGQDATKFAQDLVEVPRNADPQSKLPASRLMNLSDFRDEDLGPGGKYVTRWGGDPTRVPAAGLEAVPGQFEDDDAPYSLETRKTDFHNTFVPAAAFLDLAADTRLGAAAEYVPNVLMPIRLQQDHQKQATDKPDADQSSLNVSLITYAPCFDRDLEQWYVDAAIQHPFEAEPFVRLGLVRYQPDAPDSLRVSYPTTQWVQLLPRRDVEVSAGRSHTALHIDVQIYGLAVSSGDSTETNDPQDEIAAQRQLNISIVREHRSNGGMLYRRVIGPPQLPAERSSPITIEGFRGVWQASFEVPVNDALDRHESPSYYAYIEECEQRLPATYAEEPVNLSTANGRDSDVRISAGPRFLARVDIQV